MTEDSPDSPTEEPDPPDSLPKYLVNGVSKQDADTLRELAAYATAMADYREAKPDRELGTNAEHGTDTVPDEWEQQLKEARRKADVSGRATLTTKTIDGRDYYYLQW